MSQDKIIAYFGADVSEAEAAMLKYTRGLKAVEAATKGLNSSSAGSGLANNLGKANGLLGEISKKFTGGKILESVLGGVGMANGFAFAQKAAELISSYWQKAAESAERIAAASSETADYVSKRIGLRETEEQALAKAQRASRMAENALNADAGDDPDKTAELIRNQQKYAYELEVLQKKAAERKKAEDDKAAAEAQARKERDFQLQMDANERVRKEEAEDEKRKEDAATEAAEFFKAIDDAAAKAHEENVKKDAALSDEIEKEKYDAIWRKASAEQQLAQVIKEGREAQAKFDRTKNKEDELAVLKLKKRYDELTDSAKALNAEKENGTENEPEKGGRSVGADGKIRRRGAVVSGEDAARSDATKARNARLNADGMSARITDSGQVGSVDVKTNKTDKLLQEIRDSLKPKKVK